MNEALPRPCLYFAAPEFWRKRPRDIRSCGKDAQVRTSTKPHNAALMTEALAELLITKLSATGHQYRVADRCQQKENGGKGRSFGTWDLLWGVPDTRAPFRKFETCHRNLPARNRAAMW
jgi:hypothetical protein